MIGQWKGKMRLEALERDREEGGEGDEEAGKTEEEEVEDGAAHGLEKPQVARDLVAGK